MALLDETSNVLTVSLRGLKSNVKYAEDYVKLSVAQSANTFPTAKVSVQLMCPSHSLTPFSRAGNPLH